MYKNQLQELAQRSCFNLPSYTCIREGPDHAPRFKATVNFNGETFESPQYCSTLRQAEHSAAEIALNSLATRSPSYSLAARILDETGVYKNLLQEIAQRVGAPLPQYTTYRSGLGHLPVFTGMVELAGIIFTGEPAKNKKQAEKNAALAAWTSLKQLAKTSASSSSEPENFDELEQITVARALLNYRMKEKAALASSPSGSIPFRMKFPSQSPRPTSPQPQSAPTSKILPLICQRSSPRNLRHPLSCSSSSSSDFSSSHLDSRVARPHRFPAPGAAPYVPIRPFRMHNAHGMAPPVTIRNMIPVFSAPPVNVRQTVPVFAAPAPPMKEDKGGPQASLRTVSIKEAAVPAAKKEDAPEAQKEGQEGSVPVVQKEDAPGAQKEGREVIEKGSTMAASSTDSAVEDLGKKTATDNVEVVVVQDLKELKI